MPLNILFSASESDWRHYQPHLQSALAEHFIDAKITTLPNDPGAFDFVIWSPASPLQDFAPFTNLKAIFSLWAGVEKVAHNDTIKVPLCRMVDPGLTQGMVEWVCGQVLRHHLGLDRHILQQDGIWRHDNIPPLARDRKIGILGLGELGGACAQALAGLGFQVAGWSNSSKNVPFVSSLTGADGLQTILAQSEILVLLLPLTPGTENIINKDSIAKMRSGAFLINAGRGHLIDDSALLSALDSGQIAHATLDVFRQEPLPLSHPFWSNENITVTPHMAAETRPESSSHTIAGQIRRWFDGKPLQHTVNWSVGY